MITTSGAPRQLAAQTRTTNRPPAKTPAPQAQQTPQSKYKGIWEPISYPDDLKFLDVFFATADEGWVAGGAGELSGGMIIHTADGGDHWDVQYGDPQSSEGGIKELRFLDSTHGWAVQRTSSAARLFHTRDGKNWILSGTMDEHHTDYMFTSEKTGVQLSGRVIKITADGGRTWKPVFDCAAKIQVDGLWQNIVCNWGRLQFITPSIGYAIAAEGSNNHVFLAKTVDGGATWKLTTSEVTNQPKDAFFVDENTGYARVGYPDTGQLFKTADGGQTWTGMAASPGDRIQFADPEVGWALHYSKVSFTTDSGKRWNSREYPFPAHVETFSLPRRDRGYIVGDHGMIYRYRIVPVEYVAKGMIPAPLLSGIDSPLDAQVQQLAQQVQQLAKDTGAPVMNFTQDTGGAAGTFNTGMNPSSSSPSANGGMFTSDTGSGTAASFTAGGTVAGGTFPGSAPGCPGIGLSSPNASFGNSAQPTASYGAASTSPPSSSASGGFTQDTGASSGFMQDTSAATATVNTVSNTVPQFVSKYRNLNLMLAGFQMAAQMPAAVQCMQQSFQGLKNVKDPQAAMAAVMNIQTQMGGLVQMVRTAFQKPR